MSNYEKLTKEIGSLLDDMAARKFGVEIYLKAVEALERLTELSYRILDLEKQLEEKKGDASVSVTVTGPPDWIPVMSDWQPPTDPSPEKKDKLKPSLEEACEAIQALKNSSLPPHIIDLFLTDFNKLHNPA